ncbi:MAG: hypothetical protein ACHBN1_15115 [Heteroscytonema crispum UTEX LB 1556]
MSGVTTGLGWLKGLEIAIAFANWEREGNIFPLPPFPFPSCIIVSKI